MQFHAFLPTVKQQQKPDAIHPDMKSNELKNSDSAPKSAKLPGSTGHEKERFAYDEHRELIKNSFDVVDRDSSQ